MGEIQIQKIQRTVQVKDGDNKRKKVQKTYGKIIYRKTLSLDDMAEHIMKHGSVYTEDVVIGVITKLKSCMQEMLADGHKVKLDGIGTLYPTLTSEGVEDARTIALQRMSPAWASHSWPTRAASPCIRRATCAIPST